ASDAIIRIDEKSTIQYVNTATKRIFGYAAEEMVGQPLTMLMPEEMREPHRTGFGHYLETGERRLNWQSIEVPARHKDGHHFPLEISFGEYHSGDTRFFIGIVRDITERARAEEKLRESEEQLRALADSIPQLAWMAEPDGFIFWYNRRWYEYTGTTPEEMEGWGWQSVHDAEMLPAVLERWQASIRTGEPFEMEFPLRRGADGAFRWFLTRVVPLRDSSGCIVRWFGTNTDIEELRQARLQAEAANLLKDEFLATVSHELRTPLNAILGWSEMLKSGKATGEIAERANETIYRNAKSQAQLIEDLLDISRIITGKMKLEPRPVQIASVVESAIETLRPAANAKSIEIEIDLECKPCMIGGDEQRLQQIVWNLISNAVKFTPEGGKVEVKLENDDSHARLTVKDNGKGIEAEFLPFLFERFRQEDASSTRRHGGLGLGLAIVRNLVELHGGTISVESAGENLGATFTMKLPLISTDDKTQKNGDGLNLRETLSDGFSGADRAAKQMAGIRVLLVDDEKDTLEMLDTALTAEGANVRIAVSAADAFNILLNWQPDVLISDIAMPDEDGYSLIKKVRELKPENGGLIPAIAMTAYVRVEDRMRVLASGFQMYVPKPAEPAELINAVINLLGENEPL
ncbi:MAG: hybrid sensor histidine kinase/response regulator, partial [Pyrinomonadaceae bacterium]